MQIDIQSRGFSLTDALFDYAQRRLLFSMSYCNDYIHRIVVRLSDINGPRGGADKCCQVQVALMGMPDVVVKDTEVDLYVAIDRAIDRARRTVVRKIDKQQTRLNKQNPPHILETE